MGYKLPPFKTASFLFCFCFFALLKHLLALNPTLLYPPIWSIFSIGGAVGCDSAAFGSSMTSSLGMSPEYFGTDPAGGGAPPNQPITVITISVILRFFFTI